MSLVFKKKRHLNEGDKYQTFGLEVACTTNCITVILFKTYYIRMIKNNNTGSH